MMRYRGWKRQGEISMLLRALFLICVLCGCQKSAIKQNAQEVSINVMDEPQTLDPRKARDLNSTTIAKMLFEGLTRVSAQDHAELALAQSVAISSDLKTYTFQLRESQWANGDPLTASDFAYSWKTALSADFPSDNAFLLYVIKNAKGAKEGKISPDEIGVRALDSLTLEVELENPTPYFLELLASPIFFPVHQKSDAAALDWALNAERFVGNGPFRWREWKHQDHLTLEKNPLYWDAPTVKLERLELCMVKEETEFNMFEKKELDWAGSPLSVLPTDALQTLRLSPLLKIKETLGTSFIRINTARTPLDRIALRRALGLAVNRKLIVDHVTQGNQIPATGLVPSSFKLHTSPYFADGDAAEASALFQQCGEVGEISLIYRASERNQMIAQAIQQQWFEALGVRVRLEAIEGKVYFDRTSKGDFDLSLGNWIADFPDPINFLEVFKCKSGGSNNTQWENPRYAAFLDQSSLEANPEVRRLLLAEAEKILIDEMPIIPIFYTTMLYVNQPELKGVVLSSMGGIDFKWASKSLEGEIR